MTNFSHYPLIKDETRWSGVQLRAGNRPDVLKRPWAVRCPKPFCFFDVSATTNEEAHHLLDTHKCPNVGTTTLGWGITLTLLEEIWAELDEAMNDLMEAKAREDSTLVLTKQEYLRGIAFTLTKFMVPHFRTTQDIAAEAKRRWDARQAGDEEYETAGLAHLRFKAPPGDDKYMVKEPKGEKKRGVLAKLDDETAIKIKAAYGVMPNEMIAAAYGIKESEVETVAKS